MAEKRRYSAPLIFSTADAVPEKTALLETPRLGNLLFPTSSPNSRDYLLTPVFHQTKKPSVWMAEKRRFSASLIFSTVADGARKNFAEFHGTMYEHEGHGSWVRAYLERDVFDWMISKVNPDPKIK